MPWNILTAKPNIERDNFEVFLSIKEDQKKKTKKTPQTNKSRRAPAQPEMNRAAC